MLFTFVRKDMPTFGSFDHVTWMILSQITKWYVLLTFWIYCSLALYSFGLQKKHAYLPRLCAFHQLLFYLKQNYSMPTYCKINMLCLFLCYVFSVNLCSIQNKITLCQFIVVYKRYQRQLILVFDFLIGECCFLNYIKYLVF